MGKKAPFRTGYNPGKPIPRPRKKKKQGVVAKEPSGPMETLPLVPDGSTPATPAPAQPPEKKSTMGRRGKARKAARDAYVAIKEINKDIIKVAKERGIIVEEDNSRDLGDALRQGSGEASRLLADRRDDKVLQAIYTLIEDNIEAIVARGIMTALSDPSSNGSVMARYFIDMYTPKAPVKDDWAENNKGGNFTQIQQVLFIKMMADTSGLSMDELQKMVAEKAKNLPKVEGEKKITRIMKQIVPDEPVDEE
jgi:hypothetical protein